MNNQGKAFELLYDSEARHEKHVSNVVRTSS